jgi:hypothetical protein
MASMTNNKLHYRKHHVPVQYPLPVRWLSIVKRYLSIWYGQFNHLVFDESIMDHHSVVLAGHAVNRTASQKFKVASGMINVNCSIQAQ